MTIKKLALGACLLLAGITLAQDVTHTVKEGDTLSAIASKYGASTQAIIQANHLQSAHKLKLGQKLSVPVSKKLSRSNKTNGSTYVVVSGDNDISIARKLGVTAKELRVANMGTNWTKLQIGQSLVVPGKTNWFDAIASHAASQAKVAAKHQPKAVLVSSFPAKPQTKVVARSYTVKNGDNDWIIAKRVGIKPSELRTLNPQVKWTKLQSGMTLKLPGTKVVALNGKPLEKSPNLPPLRSRYAVIVENGVTVRRGPSIRFDAVTKVDRGTRVLVLDHEGSWYKLRFPKGTEAWVRADFLAPTKAPQVLAKASKPAAKKPTVVASKTSNAPKMSLVSNKRSTVAKKTTTRTSTRNQQATRNARRPAKNVGKPLAVASGGNGSLIDKAQSFLGVRYRYGAASRSATDCSGFTTQVFKSQGVKLPRTAAQQSTKGQKVSKSELKPGDLVFFNTRGSRVSHVGIYKGNGKFIHASSGRGKVMESSLNEGYYQRRFAGARRVIAAKPAPKKSAPKAEAKEEPKSIPSAPKTAPVEPPVAPPPA